MRDLYSATEDGAAAFERWHHGEPAERPDPADYAEDDTPERDADNACPECPTGVVVSAGPMERDTGHYPEACSAACGWTN